MKRILGLLLAAISLPALAFGQPYTETVMRQRLVGVHLQPEQARELAKLHGYLSSAGSAIIQVDNDSNRRFTYDASSDAALTFQWGDGGTTATQILTISASTADADDDSSLILAGGGASGSSRGAAITIPGEEVSGGSDITYNVGAADTHIFSVNGTTEATISDDALTFAGTVTSLIGGGNILIQVDNDAQRRFNLDASSDTALTFGFGDGGTTAAQGLTFSSRTSDADDDNELFISGGGAYGITRGAGAAMYGNEHATLAGQLTLTSGSVAGADVFIATGDDFTLENTAGTDLFTVSDAGVWQSTAGGTVASGNFTVTSGNIIGGGNATFAAGNVSFGASLFGTTTSSIGWSVVAGANTACNTTCTSGCVVGQDTGTANIFVGCSDATADVCVCAGAS